MLGAVAGAPFRPAPADPDRELEAALERQRSNYVEMKKAALPMSVEPATVFKA